MSLKTRRFQQRSSRFTQNTRIRATAGFGMIWKRIMAFWPATSWSLTLLTRQFRKIQMHILCSTVTAGTSTPAESSTRNCWTLVWRQVCLAWDAALTMARWKASGVSSNENVTMDIHLAGKVSFRRLRTTLTITTIAATSTACSSKHQCRLMSVPWTGGPDNDLHKKIAVSLWKRRKKSCIIFSIYLTECTSFHYRNQGAWFAFRLSYTTGEILFPRIFDGSLGGR